MSLLLCSPLLIAVFIGLGEVRGDSIDVCQLPVEHGLCRASFQRYYYDAKEKNCKQFIYGGCGGNKNRFLNAEECEKACAATKKKCPEICSRIYNPVCGSDGETYSNPCVLEVKACKSGENLYIEYEGRCKTKECSKACTFNYKPVCGSDGKTYANLCELEIATCESGGEIIFAHEGKCGDKCERVCSRIYRPVCGSDGKTYSNECVLEVFGCKSGIKKIHDGKCDDEDLEK